MVDEDLPIIGEDPITIEPNKNWYNLNDSVIITMNATDEGTGILQL